VGQNIYLDCCRALQVFRTGRTTLPNDNTRLLGMRTPVNRRSHCYAYCGSTPAAVITCFQPARCFSMNVRASGNVIGGTGIEAFCSISVENSGVRISSSTAACSFSTTGCGVPAGANKPFQDQGEIWSNALKPNSLKVG